MPRGGVRPGAGRKRTDAQTMALRGARVRTPGPRAAMAGAEALPLMPAPRDLPADQRVVWDELAPLAAAQRTLSKETAPAFRDLCEAVVLKRSMLAQLMVDGLTAIDVSVDGAGVEHQKLTAHPLISKYQAQVGRVETKQARFLLEATGKPVAVPEKADDPFDEFDQETVQ